MTARRIPRAFFARPAVDVGVDLLGCVLVRRLRDGARLRGRIVETEAYEPGDPASHGYRRMTERNRAMFGPPGRLYVYFTYGNHWMANVVTRRDGEPSAVLLRALEPIEGIDEMRRRRGRDRLTELCGGPGRLCQALAIDRHLNEQDLVDGTEVWIEAGSAAAPESIARGVRVGVTTGTDRDWRFFVRGDPFVSPGRPGPAPSRRSRPSRS